MLGYSSITLIVGGHPLWSTDPPGGGELPECSVRRFLVGTCNSGERK
jgi:hypothetical protein